MPSIYICYRYYRSIYIVGWRLLVSFCLPLLPIKAQTTHTHTHEGPYGVVGIGAATIQGHPLGQIRGFKANDVGATVQGPHWTR